VRATGRASVLAATTLFSVIDRGIDFWAVDAACRASVIMDGRLLAATG
jgi:hypothetical protein